MPKIIVQKGADIVKTYNLPSREEITIGCSTGCDVPIEDPALASELAKLVLKDDGFHLQLITHIPPVFVTGERVEGDVRLEDGDTIKIEDYNLILNVLPGEIPVKEEPPPEPKPEPKPPEPAPPEQPAEPPPEKVVEQAPPKEPEPVTPPPVEKKEEPAPQVREPIVPEKKEEPPKPVPPPKPEPEIIPEPEKPEPTPPPKPVKEEVSYMKTEEIKIDQDEPKPVESKIEEPPPAKPAPPEPQKEKPAPAPKPEPAKEPVAEQAPPPPVEDNRKTKVLTASGPPPPKPEKASGPVQQRPAKIELDMYLLAVGGPLSGEKFKIKKGITSIGRDRKQNDVVIRNDRSGELDKSISRRHAQIEYSNGRYLFSDKASQMRSILNGKKLSHNDVLPLSVGDIVEICSIKENTAFRVAEEGNFDFSPPSKQKSIRPSLVTGNYLPYIIGAAAVVIIIIVLILLLK